MAGDAAAGAAHYSERCAVCHDEPPGGHRLGPDLASLANPTPEELLVAIVDPGRAVEESYLAQQVETTDGRSLLGVVESQSAAALTFALTDGTRTSLAAGEVVSVTPLPSSLMPEGLEAGLGPAEMADLLAFLLTRRPSPKRFPGNEPRTVALDGESVDGETPLTASTARVFGPGLVFEPEGQNLGYWASEDDYAQWEVEVARPGRFEAWLEAACPPEHAWQEVVLSAGSAEVTGRVPDTRAWGDYHRRFMGTLDLPAGRSTVTVRSAGPVRDYLMDLRALHLRRIGG
jgi:putative heme-binding domain-containing protein